MKKATLMIVIPVLLSGCGSLSSMFSGGGSAPQIEPTKLQPIQASVALEKLWSHDTGVGNPDRYTRLEPAAGGDQVYTADRKGQVTAYAAGSGKQNWRTQLKQPVTGGVGLGSGLVIVGTEGGRVAAIDARSGKVRWTNEVSSEVLAPPTGDAGVVVVRTEDGKLYGMSAEDGHHLWIYERSVPALTLRGTGAPLVYRGMVLTGFAGGKLVANNLQSGHDLWEATVAQPRGRNEIERLVDIDAKPVVAGDSLYAAAYQGRVAAIGLGTGRVLWTRELSSYRRLAVDGNNLYLTDDESHILALDRATGATVWKQDGLVGRRATGPVVLGGYVAVADMEGYVHLLSKIDGSFAARVRVGRGPLDRPVSDGGRLFVQENDGTLTVFALHK